MDRGRRKLLVRWAESQLGARDLDRIRMLPTRQNEYGFDSFGFNRDDAKVALVVVRWLYRNYFRAEVHGLSNVPAGRVMLVANHSGQLPFDAVNIVSAMVFDGQPPRLPRSMIEHFVPTLPYVSYLFSRWGQVVGTPENCRRLLDDEEILLVFPEGVRGISKPYTQRYQLQDFGLGFMRLALETKAPIVPVAVIGAEEQAPAFNLRFLAKLFGAPSFPVMPVPPFLPLLPLPSRYYLYFGEPMMFDGDADEDDEHVEQLVRQVRFSIESMLRVGLKERTRVYL